MALRTQLSFPVSRRLADTGPADGGAITVIRAATEVDIETVAMVRANGYDRQLRQQDPKVTRWVDVADRNGSAFALLALDHEGRAVGTLRIQDSRKGSLELQRFIDLAYVLAFNERPAAQLSRISILHGVDRAVVARALLDAAAAWCRSEGVRCMIMAVPRRLRPFYEALAFRECGPRGEFRHAFAGTQAQSTLIRRIEPAVSRQRAMRWARHRVSGEAAGALGFAH